MATDTETSQATNDAYTGMLAISLAALIGGCVLLYLDFQQYPDKAPRPPSYAAPKVVIEKAPDDPPAKPD